MAVKRLLPIAVVVMAALARHAEAFGSGGGSLEIRPDAPERIATFVIAVLVVAALVILAVGLALGFGVAALVRGPRKPAPLLEVEDAA